MQKRLERICTTGVACVGVDTTIGIKEATKHAKGNQYA
jgi:uroporphyrinogen-III decarboxylase